ncbi:hypothetical protein BC830DRAFT_294798 [Chytriomyces sp. MP71]|nr:hypothetical protein BC830DRAFT_294798 [Chytriomyces sp. MP71]
MEEKRWWSVRWRSARASVGCGENWLRQRAVAREAPLWSRFKGGTDGYLLLLARCQEQSDCGRPVEPACDERKRAPVHERLSVRRLRSAGDGEARIRSVDEKRRPGASPGQSLDSHCGAVLPRCPIVGLAVDEKNTHFQTRCHRSRVVPPCLAGGGVHGRFKSEIAVSHTPSPRIAYSLHAHLERSQADYVPSRRCFFLELPYSQHFKCIKPS